MTEAKPFMKPKAPTKIQSAALGAAVVALSKKGKRLAIELRRTRREVSFIPLELGSMRVDSAPCSRFDADYQPTPGNPPARIAQLFSGYAQRLGATTEAIGELSKLVTISKKEKEMMIGKQAARHLAENPPAKKKRASKKKKAATVKRESAPRMFRKLIMSGEFSDAEIFKQVQEKFALSDDKIDRVAWYRTNLEKAGMKPPPRIVRARGR